MALAMSFIIMAQIYLDRGNARIRAEAEATNLGSAIAGDIDRHLNLFQFLLGTLRDTITSPAFSQIPPELRERFLFEHSAIPHEMGVLFVTDATGTIMMGAGDGLVTGESRSWRPYFDHHRRRNDRDLLISGPYLALSTGEPVLMLSMRVSGPDGSFQGVVAASMRLEYFDSLFADITLPPNASVTLLLNGSTVLARKPALPEADAVITRQETVLLPIAGAVRSGRPQASRVDDHLVITTPVTQWPLRLELAKPLHDIYQDWRANALTVGFTAAALLVGFVTLIIKAHLDALQRSRAKAELAEANSRLEQLATTDPLTGIANRRMFDDLMRREQARISRKPHDTVVMMIDIDLFKPFNDTYGHGAGDAALRSVAQAIAAAVPRGGDTAARLGGEEFGVLLTDTDMAGAITVAERVHELVAAIGIRHGGSPHQHVTVSIGLAGTFGQPEGTTLEQLLTLADRALYDAKRNGRNRIEIHRPPVPSLILGAAV
ncbi:diguanylate cyclase [Niveispirillum fermenti]|uniref:sensor domain-containing diguanylate cyclase n=1 Tax=Niveispirillum fermenti TaxID=1233113 RepID=UPI003A864227